MVRLLKHKIRPENAYFKAHDFDFILSAPKEELHQFFIGLYGDHLLPATMHEIEKLLRGPDTVKSLNKKMEPPVYHHHDFGEALGNPRRCGDRLVTRTTRYRDM